MALAAPMTIAGNLTADPDLKYTAKGKAVVSFTIAMTPQAFDPDTGKWTDGETLFMRCSAWDNMAEHIAHSLTKGNRVIAYGQVKSRSYEDREKQKRTVMEMVVEELGLSLKWSNAMAVKESGKSSFQDPKPDNDGWVTVDDDTPF